MKDNRKFNDQETIRRQRLEELKKNNNDPFMVKKVTRTHNSSTFKKKYDSFSREDLHLLKDDVTLAGRVISIRQTFAVVKDFYGTFQVYFDRKSNDDKSFESYKSIDIGDFLSFTGTPMKTNTNSLTLNIKSFKLISKSLKVLPEKWHGLVDEEERARRRYVDLIVNQESMNTLIMRRNIIKTIRNYMDDQDYYEIDTPVLQPILGGANAKPFITHHNALDMQFYLRIATELHLKRLIVGGFEKVYELGRVFRNEGIDATHNPEFSSIEIYAAYEDMNYMMNFTEELFKHIARKMNVGQVTINGNEINLLNDFKRINILDFIREETGVDFRLINSYEEAKKIAIEKGIRPEKKHNSIGHIVNLFFEEFCEKKCIQPTFVFGHPVEVSPLAKSSDNEPKFTDRFELFINTKEYANAYSELNDPIVQYERFADQLKLKELGDDEANEMDLDFIESLEYGMPPTAGLGIGIDRLVMLFSSKTTIRDVLAFPHMRNKTTN